MCLGVKGKPHLDGCTMYTSCEPCSMCASVIHLARMSRVVFAANMDAVNPVLTDGPFVDLREQVARPILESKMAASQVFEITDEAEKIIVKFYDKVQL